METISSFAAGDRVKVLDPGLQAVAKIFRDATGEEPPPNDTGTVDSVEGDYVYIIFDDSESMAPYPTREVRHLV